MYFQHHVEALRSLREFYSYLPLSNKDEPPVVKTDDSRERREE